ncbi:hypothetical protein H0H92_014941 [Tricholoma furcatifolium]|nr:hypothetical protein H0H92_014941 [Tricholoma furcatifolium]
MPSLSTFDFWSHLTEPPKLLEKLASDLSQLPELKRFGLTKGYSYRDESMLEDALLILRANPSLQEITLRWARESSHNHLKQAGVYEITSQDGMPEYIMVHEQGIPLFGPPFERRYKYYLKPRTLIDTLKQHRTLQLLHNR